MTAKNYICILAGAALLVSCAPTTTTTTTATHRHDSGTVFPSPRPSPTPVPGKRTETGTVIRFTAQQITLQIPGKGTWIINVTASTEVIGTLKVGSKVTVKSNSEDWQQRSA